MSETLFGELDPSALLKDSNGEGVKVGILDTGLDLNHKMMGAVKERLRERLCFLTGRRREDPDPGDAASHGTPVTWIINQVAPAAELYFYRALSSGNRGGAEAFEAALDHAIEAQLDVLNLSLGLESFNAVWKSRFLDLADRAYYRGIILVASASNRSDWILPGSLASLISVDMDHFEDPLRVQARASELLAYGPKPHIWLDAMGTMVKAPKAGSEGCFYYTGTSFAAPHVTGIVARLLSRSPGLKPFEVKTLLYHMGLNHT